MAQADIAHLHRRAGFGGTAAQIASLTTFDRAGVVDHVMDVSAAPVIGRPAAVTDQSVSSYERYVGLVRWWFDHMATTSVPFVEKMALFWGGHFTSANNKIDEPALLVDQQNLFRSRGLGSFLALTQAVAVDPAMLLYLDNADNRKGSPNENFARELMELFLLGVGHYGESDVAASARAWTGHTVDRTSLAYVFDPAKHDDGAKTFLGKSAAWNGPDIINELLTRPDTLDVAARFIATKAWSFFAHPGPPPGVIDALSGVFVASGLDIRTLIRAIFMRDEFYAPAAKLGLVRTPIEYVVAIMKASGLPASEIHPEWFLPGLGQEAYNPPDVSGWKQNRYWISVTAEKTKANLGNWTSFRMSERGSHVLANSATLTPDAAVQRAFDLFAIDAPSANSRAVLAGFMQRQRSAAYQAWFEPLALWLLSTLLPELQMA